MVALTYFKFQVYYKTTLTDTWTLLYIHQVIQYEIHCIKGPGSEGRQWVSMC